MFRASTWMLVVGSVLIGGRAQASPIGECSPYGANVHIPDETTLQAIADAGISWVRMDFNWFQIEPQKGDYRFDVVERAVDEARARGLEVFATLAYSPKWAVADQTCEDGTSNPCRTKPPAKVADWTDFVIATVRHFKGRVQHWGMWNEPNLADFFQGTLDDYVDRILVPGAQAVKWEDPASLVLGPELAGVTDASQWNGDQGSCLLGFCTFNGWEIDLALILDKAGSSIDIITHHFYKSNQTRLMEAVLDGEFDNLVGLVKTHSSLKEIVEKHAPSKEVWLTEYGWETPAYGGWIGGGSVSETNQASYHVGFLDALTQVAAGTWSGSDNDPWPNLARVFLYDARDSVVNGRLYAFGILRVDGTPKPAYHAIQDFIRTHPPSCPPRPPTWKTLPLLSLEQGGSAVKALDLWDFTQDPDTPKEKLVYSLVDAGHPGAGLTIEDGHFLSAYPEKGFSGFTQGRVRVDDGQFQAEADFGVSVKPVVVKTYEAVWLQPSVDGDLSEWGGIVQIPLTIEKDWVALDGGTPAGPLDLSANGRLTWDDGHLFLAFEVTDNVHIAHETAEVLWQGDSVQFALDLGNDQTEGAYDDDDDWEIGVAFFGEAVLIHCFHTPMGVEECPVLAAARRKANRTAYEVAFATQGIPPESFGMSLLVNENDGSGREGFLQWTPGIGLTKDPSRYGRVTRVGGPPTEESEPKDESIAAESNGEEIVVETVPEMEGSEDILAGDLNFFEEAGIPDAIEGDENGSDVWLDTDSGERPSSGGGCGCRTSGSLPVGESFLFVMGMAFVWCYRRSKRTQSPIEVKSL